MNRRISRRGLLVAPPGYTLAGALLAGLPLRRAGAEPAPPPGSRSPLWPGFPRQPVEQVRAIVTVAHGQIEKVRELVEARPALVNAWWDWGFGDWESPLGAASHTGQRAIAEYLIERGARIDLFAAAMLGMTDVVRGFVAAQPGVQRTRGPHGISLLAHARVGGERAKETLKYLESLGDAGTAPASVPLPDERRQIYPGRYAVQGAADEVLEVRINPRGQLTLEVRDPAGMAVPRSLLYAGEDEFFLASVPSVRVRFEVRDGRAQALKLVEREPVVTAARVAAP